ncbi:hypothetical protein FF011L_25130 [Roseimaritima multifibrata]|uniref:DUF2272 domain-containing protein n=1 Tax=Roseimaritima multifibrata TaxID=1930274 RepID=A0A517MFS7_9BACT|nr:DUF2272 domain-containing protein [Roseimaritima multifibrata]QDS93740.1 hypothetical protein FF011L_25130 [Roseimaritima multifibrata]
MIFQLRTVVCFCLLGLVQSALLRADEIAKSVGRGGDNQPSDVLTVQLALNQLPRDGAITSELLETDGLAGPITVAAIENFQRQTLGADAVTGLIEADGAVMERLNELVRAQPLTYRIARVALGERLFWRDGERTEREPVVTDRLRDYWLATDQTFTAEQIHDPAFQSEWPWSAAFISWVMKRAGSGDDFFYADSHWQYTAAAKANRLKKNDNPFQAFPIRDLPVTVGDVIVKRRSTSTATYENIERGHPTHGDIVIEFKDGEVVTIGGNVSNSVRTTMVPIDDEHKVTNKLFFAIVDVDPNAKGE